MVSTATATAAASAAAAAAAAAATGSGEDAHTALNPDLVLDPSVCILTVIVGEVAPLVKGPGMELPRLSPFPL